MRLFNYGFNKKMNSAISFCLALVLVFVASLNVGASTLSELKDKEKELESKIEENNNKLNDIEKGLEEKTKTRDELNTQIEAVQTEIDSLNKRIDELNKEITDGEAKIAVKEEAIADSLALLKERLKAIYVSGEASNLSILLGSTDMMDYAARAEILRAVSQHDTQLIESLSEAMAEIKEDLVPVNAAKEELSETKKEADRKYDELSELYTEIQGLISEAEDAHAATKANSDSLSTELGEVDDAIKKLEEELAAQNGGSSVNLGGTGYEGTGNFVWPMPGYTYITCYYGDGGHRGIDIAGGNIYGKAIVAADSGYVTYAGWNDSYGYCVFIDHGNGYETRYAHMSSLGTTTGSYVSSYETIGYVGSTGNSTGPHLHFEVIYNGGTTNPFNYF